jgi:hypothetical protein
MNAGEFYPGMLEYRVQTPKNLQTTVLYRPILVKDFNFLYYLKNSIIISGIPLSKPVLYIRPNALYFYRCVQVSFSIEGIFKM